MNRRSLLKSLLGLPFIKWAMPKASAPWNTDVSVAGDVESTQVAKVLKKCGNDFHYTTWMQYPKQTPPTHCCEWWAAERSIDTIGRPSVVQVEFAQSVPVMWDWNTIRNYHLPHSEEVNG